MDDLEVRYVDLREEEAHARNFAERHGGHTQHWCNGSVMRCSCGEAVGRFMLTDGVFVPQRCRVCNEEAQMDDQEFAEFETTEEEFDRVMAQDEPLIVRKMAYTIPISTEDAMEYGLIPDTRPASPPPTWRQRARWKVRQTVRDIRWRLAAWIGGVPREDIEEASSLW